MKESIVKGFVISTFVALYLMVSVISTIHVIDFFEMSNPYWLAVSLAVAFELGAAASLASIIALKKMNQTLVWALFIIITLMQMQGNMYYAFTNLSEFQSWSELFNLMEEDLLYQKRVLAAVSGAILPLVALGFIKSLVDYIRPDEHVDAVKVVDEKPNRREVVKKDEPVAPTRRKRKRNSKKPAEVKQTQKPLVNAEPVVKQENDSLADAVQRGKAMFDNNVNKLQRNEGASGLVNPQPEGQVLRKVGSDQGTVSR